MGSIDYFSTFGSYWYVFKLIVGSTDFTGMELGDKNEKLWLYFTFIACAFVIYVHFLNMLIAIMGESFSKNNEVSDAKTKISQLRFVVDNWWIEPIKDKQKIIYLVAALPLCSEPDD